MIFAKIKDNVIIEYPVNDNELRFIFENVCLPVNLENCDYLIDNGWVNIIETAIPTINELEQYITEGAPELLNGSFRQVWIINNLSNDVIKLNKIEDTQIKINHFIYKVEKHMDSVANSLHYESRLSVCSYINSGVAKFHNDAVTFIAWRDAVWIKCLQIQNDVLTGIRVMPTFEEALSEIPVFVL